MRNFTKTLLVSATMLVFFVSAVNAATVTYSLKKHIDKGTITATATVNSAAEIPEKLPNILKRAYCTYTYYWDAALTQPVQDTDALQGTVYVDYVFDPPFVISTSTNKVYYFLTTYEPTHGKEWIRVHTKAVDIVCQTQYENGTTPPANSDIRNGQFDYALYGDAYNLQIRNRWSNQYLYPDWASYASYGTIKHNNTKYQDWNLYTNTTVSQGHETCTIGAPNGSDYSDIWCIQQNWNGASYITRTYNSSVGNYSQSDIAWWFDLSMDVTQAMYQYRVYMEYNRMKLRATTDLKVYSAVVPAVNFMLNAYSSYRLNGFTYTYYKDEAMTQEYAEGETIPKTDNGITIVYVKESWPDSEPYVTDHWITLALSYRVTNLANEFGYAADGVTPAVRVLEYTALTTNEANTKYALTFTETNSIVAHKPYLFKADEVLEGYALRLSKDANFYVNNTEADLDGLVNGNKVTWKDNAHNSPDVTMIGTYYDKELTVFSDHPNLLYFYFGYDKRYDSASSDYVGEEAAAGKEPYNFYRVTQKPVTMKKNRCYFMIEGAPAGAKFMLMDNFGEEISGVEGFEVERTVPTGRIYNLNGQMVGTDLEALPRGLYIVNGKKVMK